MVHLDLATFFKTSIFAMLLSVSSRNPPVSSQSPSQRRPFYISFLKDQASSALSTRPRWTIMSCEKRVCNSRARRLCKPVLTLLQKMSHCGVTHDHRHLERSIPDGNNKSDSDIKSSHEPAKPTFSTLNKCVRLVTSRLLEPKLSTDKQLQVLFENNRILRVVSWKKKKKWEDPYVSIPFVVSLFLLFALSVGLFLIKTRCNLLSYIDGHVIRNHQRLVATMSPVAAYSGKYLLQGVTKVSYAVWPGQLLRYRNVGLVNVHAYVTSCKLTVSSRHCNN